MTEKAAVADPPTDRAEAGSTARERAGELAQSAGDAMRASADAVVQRAPDAISASRDVVDQAGRQLHRSTTHELMLALAFSLGAWLGSTLGRAPRVLSLGAAAASVLFGATLLVRRDDPTSDGSR